MCRNFQPFPGRQVMITQGRGIGGLSKTVRAPARVTLSIPKATQAPFSEHIRIKGLRGVSMAFVRSLWNDEHGQDVAEYAVMLAVILVIVVGTVRLIGSNANNVFSNVASSVQ